MCSCYAPGSAPECAKKDVSSVLNDKPLCMGVPVPVLNASTEQKSLCFALCAVHLWPDCEVRQSGWTDDVGAFLGWLDDLQFCGGGTSEAAVADGLAEALWVSFLFFPRFLVLVLRILVCVMSSEQPRPRRDCMHGAPGRLLVRTDQHRHSG